MASQDDTPLSIESLFSAFMERKPEAVEKITLKLDMEISRVVKNWRHFARELKVAPGFIENLKWYGSFSPTQNVFDSLGAAKPDLTIGTLKKVFTDIGRKDLKQLLDGVFKPEDDKEKVTAVSDKFPLSAIALGLNRFEGAIANWEKFALHKMIGVAENRGDLHQFESPLLEDPTAELFHYLEKQKSRSQLTLGELYNVLSSDSVKRVSTAERLIDPKDSSWRSRLVKEVIHPESDLLGKISSDLNKKVYGTGDWKIVAYKLGIPHEEYCHFGDPKEKRSPTREVFDKVFVDRAGITILEIIKALKNIDRYDVIEVITEQLGVEDSTQAMKNLSVAMPDEEDAGVILPEPSVSPGPSESGGPSGLTAPTDPQPQVFLSYQWDIKAKVIELKEKLKLKGLTCWMDEDEMDPGDELRGEIEHGISHCKVFISCMTKKYCTSKMCGKEATLASEREKHIIPVLFEDLDGWPPQGPLGMVFSDILYLKLPGGILNNEKFEKISKKIMELVRPQNK